MATLPTIKELRVMQAKDLQSEIAEQSRVLAKLRLDVAMGGEKDTAKLRRLRRAIARMQTVATEKEGTAVVELKKTKKAAKVSAPKNS